MYSLQLEWGFKSSSGNDYFMLDAIDLLSIEHTLKNEVYSVSLDEAIIKLINSLNILESSIKNRITGYFNSKINYVANLNIPVKVESETIASRFELF